MSEELERMQYLMKVLRYYFEENPVMEYTIHFDDAKCDGQCLLEDMESAFDALQHNINTPDPIIAELVGCIEGFSSYVDQRTMSLGQIKDLINRAKGGKNDVRKP